MRVLGRIKRWVPEPLKRWYRSAYWPHWSLRWLPGSSVRFGPPRHWVGLNEYLAHAPGRRMPGLPAQAMPAFTFHACNAIPARFQTVYQAEVPAAEVLELPDVSLLGAAGWVVGAGDRHLLDPSFWGRPLPHMRWRDHYLLRRRRALPRRHLRGRTLSLASDFSMAFGHFIHDSMTRLAILDAAGVDPNHYDQVYWPLPISPATPQLVAASGIDPQRILAPDPQSDLHCEHLTVTTFPGRPGHIAPVYLDAVRRRLVPHPVTRHRRLYLSRTGFRRNFARPQEVEAVLQSFGYEACHPHEDPHTLRKCAESTHIVAIEGANWFNAVTAAPGTRVLLILPDAANHVPYAASLSLSAGHALHLLAARSLDQPRTDPGIAPIEVDLDELRLALDAMDRAPT